METINIINISELNRDVIVEYINDLNSTVRFTFKYNKKQKLDGVSPRYSEMGIYGNSDSMAASIYNFSNYVFFHSFLIELKKFKKTANLSLDENRIIDHIISHIKNGLNTQTEAQAIEYKITSIVTRIDGFYAYVNKDVGICVFFKTERLSNSCNIVSHTICDMDESKKFKHCISGSPEKLIEMFLKYFPAVEEVYPHKHILNYLNDKI